MKQTDIALLVVIVSISLFVSYFIGNTLFANDESRSAEVKVAEEISSEFPQPSPEIFNSSALNLTETIKIGNTKSDVPFTTGEN